MELLDKELELNRGLASANLFLKGAFILATVMGLVIMIPCILYDVLNWIMIVLSLVLMLMILVYPWSIRKRIIKEIQKLEDNTVKFEKFTVTAQVISKSRESSTKVYGGENNISSRTTHDYIVGVRTTNGNLLTINSKELYMGSVEGEFIDILIKQKLDKNNILLDSSKIPLMKTIRATL